MLLQADDLYYDLRHSYTFPDTTKFPRIVVDITNDGQQSSTDPTMVLDPKTGRVKGGAQFAGSFGIVEASFQAIQRTLKAIDIDLESVKTASGEPLDKYEPRWTELRDVSAIFARCFEIL